MLKKRRPSEILCRIDVTGFVSILVVLLVLMMSPYMPHRDLGGIITVSQVPARHAVALPQADREDAIMVAVMRDGKVYLGTQLMYEGLADHLRDRLRAGAEKKVYIRADARAHYHNVKYVLDEVRLAGIEKVAFLTEQTRKLQ